MRTDIKDPAAYWRKLKQRLKEEGNETVTNCHGLKMTAADGKKRMTDVATTGQLLRIIQSNSDSDHRLKDEAKELSLVKELRDLDFDGLGERVPLIKVYEHFKEKYNLAGTLGVAEDKSKTNLKEHFNTQGVQSAGKLLDGFWNTINGSKVNVK